MRHDMLYKTSDVKKEMMGRVGLEPTAKGLKGRCSTIELPTQSLKSYLEEQKNLFVIW